jgi:hypothetical protein
VADAEAIVEILVRRVDGGVERGLGLFEAGEGAVPDSDREDLPSGIWPTPSPLGQSLVTVPSDCPRVDADLGYHSCRSIPALRRAGMSRTRSQILQSNEKLKAAAGIVTNLGAALFATALGRWFLTGFDLFVPLWLAGAINVIVIGINMLTYLEAEASNG